MKNSQTFKKKNIKFNWMWIIGFTYILIFFVNSNYSKDEYIEFIKIWGYSENSINSLSDYYKLLTTQFIHLNWIHLAANMIVFFAMVSKFNKKKVSMSKVFIIYIFSILMVATAALIFSKDNNYGIGSSGSMCALISSYSVVSIKDSLKLSDSKRNVIVFNNILSNIIIIVSSYIIPIIDIIGHIAGLLAGIRIGTILFWNDK